MTIPRAFECIREILAIIRNGEIRLLIRNGEIKYINVLHEYNPQAEEKNVVK